MDDWNEYKEGWKKSQIIVIPSVKPTSSTAYIGNNNNPQSNACNFSKKIKNAHSQYKVLKDGRQFNNWKRSFLAVARTHKLDVIFDGNCELGLSPDEQALWKKEQQFFSSVFDLTLKIDYGKTLVQ
jgi:hypothetical protein